MKAEILEQIQKAKRVGGIIPRVKKTAEEEARPTKVAWFDKTDEANPAFRPLIALEDERDELDFVLGLFPLRMRPVQEGESLSGFLSHHVEKDEQGTPVKVPAVYDGLKEKDVIVLSLGGLGDNLSFALSRQAEKVGALVLRCPPSQLKAFRETKGYDKKADQTTLVELLQTKPEVFYPVFVRERRVTYMRECLRSRTDAMKARIACEQRLRQRVIGQIFCNEEGKFPEGEIEKQFDLVKASDKILEALKVEEHDSNKALEKACRAVEVYRELFEPIKGVGPAIASRLISAIQDIRRFDTKWKLRKFCGTFCLPDGRFPRWRKGEGSGWNPDARQALFLLGDQFNRRPDSEWGAKLLENKVYYRTRHPEEIPIGGKKKYTKAHIHRMALWKTLGEFVEWLFAAWWKLEGVEATPEGKIP